jgi:hypothetical protein
MWLRAQTMAWTLPGRSPARGRNMGEHARAVPDPTPYNTGTPHRCNRTPNSISPLRPTVEERSSRLTIARCIFLCRVACVCLVPWARTCLSAGQHRHVAHRHASHTASILAVLLYAVALPGIANRKSSSWKV